MSRLLTLYVGLLIVLLGCGNGGSTSPEKTAGSAKDVAAFAECSDSFKDAGSDKMMFATDGGTCTVGSDEVIISWFNSTEARDNYREVGEAMGGGAAVVFGDNWAIECTDLEPCKEVAQRTGRDLNDAG